KACMVMPPDARVVVLAAADGLVEDGWVRRQPGQAVLADPAFQGAVVEHPPGDVVQPEALADGAQRLEVRIHHASQYVRCLSMARCLPRADRASSRRPPCAAPRPGPSCRSRTSPLAQAGPAPGPRPARLPPPPRRG